MNNYLKYCHGVKKLAVSNIRKIFEKLLLILSLICVRQTKLIKIYSDKSSFDRPFHPSLFGFSVWKFKQNNFCVIINYTSSYTILCCKVKKRWWTKAIWRSVPCFIQPVFLESFLYWVTRLTYWLSSALLDIVIYTIYFHEKVSKENS